MKNETFGARLLYRRKKLKLSQAALGKLVKVAHVTISQWERDETQPAGKRLFALSQALQCSPTWLLFGDEDKQPGEPIPDNQPVNLTEDQKSCFNCSTHCLSQSKRLCCQRCVLELRISTNFLKNYSKLAKEAQINNPLFSPLSVIKSTNFQMLVFFTSKNLGFSTQKA